MARPPSGAPSREGPPRRPGRSAKRSQLMQSPAFSSVSSAGKPQSSTQKNDKGCNLVTPVAVTIDPLTFHFVINRPSRTLSPPWRASAPKGGGRIQPTEGTHAATEIPAPQYATSYYRIMRDPAIPGRLLAAPCHSIVADDGGNAQAIVAEDSTAACRLRCAMGGVAAPLRDGSLVAPEGHGKQLVGVRKTLEPFNRDKSVHMLQLNAQARGVIQVVGFAAVGRPSLKDDGDHRLSS